MNNYRGTRRVPLHRALHSDEARSSGMPNIRDATALFLCPGHRSNYIQDLIIILSAHSIGLRIFSLELGALSDYDLNKRVWLG